MKHCTISNLPIGKHDKCYILPLQQDSVDVFLPLTLPIEATYMGDDKFIYVFNVITDIIRDVFNVPVKTLIDYFLTDKTHYKDEIDVMDNQIVEIESKINPVLLPYKTLELRTFRVAIIRVDVYDFLAKNKLYKGWDKYNYLDMKKCPRLFDSSSFEMFNNKLNISSLDLIQDKLQYSDKLNKHDWTKVFTYYMMPEYLDYIHKKYSWPIKITIENTWASIAQLLNLMQNLRCINSWLKPAPYKCNAKYLYPIKTQDDAYRRILSEFNRFMEKDSLHNSLRDKGY